MSTPESARAFKAYGFPSDEAILAGSTSMEAAGVVMPNGKIRKPGDLDIVLPPDLMDDVIKTHDDAVVSRFRLTGHRRVQIGRLDATEAWPIGNEEFLSAEQLLRDEKVIRLEEGNVAYAALERVVQIKKWMAEQGMPRPHDADDIRAIEQHWVAQQVDEVLKEHEVPESWRGRVPLGRIALLPGQQALIHQMLETYNSGLEAWRTAIQFPATVFSVMGRPLEEESKR